VNVVTVPRPDPSLLEVTAAEAGRAIPARRAATVALRMRGLRIFMMFLCLVVGASGLALCEFDRWPVRWAVAVRRALSMPEFLWL
jgi:hypothetical protein